MTSNVSETYLIRIQQQQFVVNLFCHVQQQQEEWKIVFVTTAGLYLAGFIVYFLTADSNVQSWALAESPKESTGEEKQLVNRSI